MEQFLRNLSLGKCFLISLVVFGIYYAMIFDNGSGFETQIATAQAEILRQEAELKGITKAEADAARYEETMKVLGDQMNRISKALPEELSTTDMLKTVTSEAKTTGLEINRVSPNQSRGNDQKGDSFYETVDIDAELSGQFTQVMLFLANMTKLDKIVMPRSLSLQAVMPPTTGIKANNVTPRVTMSTKIMGYRYLRAIDATSSGGTK